MSLILVHTEEGLTTLALAGRLDSTAIATIEPEFMRKAVALKKPLLVDMSQVTFMASICIRMFVEAAKTLKVSGARLALLKPTPFVEKTLTASGFHFLVGMYHDEGVARAKLLERQA